MVDMKGTIEQFIGIYDDVVPSDVCQNIIKISDTVAFSPRSDIHKQDRNFTIDGDYTSLAQQLNNHCLLPVLKEYSIKFPYIKYQPLFSSTVNYQVTEPCEGYHTWHSENSQWINSSRMIAWTVYLNDVLEGGETEFLYQKRKIQPKAGRLAIWPGGFTHLHRGNPPLTRKHILTGWWQGAKGMESHFTHEQ
jgi:hypothetical protein